ncbi:MAG: polyphosphate kinase 2 family protein [Candidatus Obscuribacterales bacterium]|nr:polyphosphate kinase 2 family protein [Candidatus Obscuribacterales bacterium]
MPTSLETLNKIAAQIMVQPHTNVSLKKDFCTKWSTDDISKDECSDFLKQGIETLSNLQDKLYAQKRRSVLIILQAMDAAGKDSTIKHVMSGVNPQGCQVTSFKTPSVEELSHDYLWRCVKALPASGNIGIFNRSYYEEVLVTRVHPEFLALQNLPPELVGKDLWLRRFKEINNFEEYLTQNGTTVIKFFLNVSKDEQRKRFLKRIDLSEKNWKFSANDAKERLHWDEYIKAYEDCLSNTSTKCAPWYVVPADNKPFMRLMVGHIICSQFQQINPQYPKLNKEQRDDLQAAAILLNEESDGAVMGKADKKPEPVQSEKNKAERDKKE